ncbi:protein TIFY 5A-like [Canna indica]|uniref:Protein TIFY n=1 Tax=Canna indica TaxID=4628 RepID=A0AAQ3KVD4_9LILI|nr:protein TIFY 5A-like [Canna indica]
MAEIGCDPELRLSLGVADGDDNGRAIRRPSSARLSRVASLLKNSEPKKQQMTIFYKGRVCVCDATEFQARAIISMANKEMDGMKMMKNTNQQQESTDSTHCPPPLSSPRPVPQILNPGQSMRRSLQMFLQKRKARIHEASPYTQKHKLFLFPIELKQA